MSFVTLCGIQLLTSDKRQNHIECGVVITRSIFSQTFTIDTHTVMYGVSLVEPASDWYSAPVPVIMYAIFYNIGPRYNGTRLQVFLPINPVKTCPNVFHGIPILRKTVKFHNYTFSPRSLMEWHRIVRFITLLYYALVNGLLEPIRW